MIVEYKAKKNEMVNRTKGLLMQHNANLAKTAFCDMY
jgi:hypothetical protein